MLNTSFSIGVSDTVADPGTMKKVAAILEMAKAKVGV
jgi:hypothetical protein